ncbi:MAG: AMP-binding protein [Chitinispirillaceae bacterium]|nr:AMP-binding protein [Chitinispirillaceae bacterium]
MPLLTDHIHFNRIIFRDRIFTGDYLQKAIDDFALYLDRNIRSNSRIVYLFAPNHIKTVIAFLGIIKTGRAALLVDPKVGKLEYEEMLADTKPSAIVEIDPAPIEFDFDKEIELTDNRMDDTEISQLDDVCLLLYSNAEDGYAKAAMLTHRNLLSNALTIAAENRANSDSISSALLPFHHIFGLQYGIITPFIGGGSILICDVSNIRKLYRDAEEICRNKISHVYSIPIIFYLFSKSPYIDKISNQIYSIISGGYKLPLSLQLAFKRKWNIQIIEGYGLTESSAGCTWQCKDDLNNVNSIGRAVTNYQVKIFNESNIEAPHNQKGEICIKGEGVMKGYFKHSESTKTSIINGWLHSGDYGTQDEKGYLYYCGLKKKMFNIAGNKAYPEEIIRLVSNSGLVNHLELYSIYNEIIGDEIHATVALSDSSTSAQENFRKWCKYNLTPYKIPKRIVFS